MKYLEDFVPGEAVTVGAHMVTTDEIVTFGRLWDPLPAHTDPQLASASPFGGLIASGAHLMAITVRLLVTAGDEPIAIIAALGWDDVRFLNVVRPGDTLRLSRRCIEARPSQSKPDRGVLRNELLLANQSGVPVLSYTDSILVRRRPVSR